MPRDPVPGVPSTVGNPPRPTAGRRRPLVTDHPPCCRRGESTGTTPVASVHPQSRPSPRLGGVGGSPPLFLTARAHRRCQPPSAALDPAVGTANRCRRVGDSVKPAPRRSPAAEPARNFHPDDWAWGPRSPHAGRPSDAGPRPLGWSTTGCVVRASLAPTARRSLAAPVERFDNSYPLSQNGRLRRNRPSPGASENAGKKLTVARRVSQRVPGSLTSTGRQ
jgi:hypothetical protein